MLKEGDVYLVSDDHELISKLTQYVDVSYNHNTDEMDISSLNDLLIYETSRLDFEIRVNDIWSLNDVMHKLISGRKLKLTIENKQLILNDAITGQPINILANNVDLDEDDEKYLLAQEYEIAYRSFQQEDEYGNPIYIGTILMDSFDEKLITGLELAKIKI